MTSQGRTKTNRSANMIALVALMAALALCIHTTLASDTNDQAAGNALPDPQAPPVREPELVSLNFPDDMELKLLAEYVSQRTGLKLLYDPKISGKRITIKAPTQVPVDSLVGLLESALKMNGMVLVDDEQPGWKRIVQTNKLIEVAPAPAPGISPQEAPEGAEAVRPLSVVMRIFTLRHTSAKQAETVIRDLLTPQGAGAQVIEDLNLLLVTDYAVNVERIARMIELIDQPKTQVVARFIPVRHMEAAELMRRVTQLLAAKQKAQGAPIAPSTMGGIDVSSDDRTNQLVVFGTPERVEEVVELAAGTDVPLGLETRIYALKTASPERVDRLTKQLIGELTSKRLYQSTIDKEANLLVVTATADIHTTVASLAQDLDTVPVTEASSRIRFYKLYHTTAAEVLSTISNLEGTVPLGVGGGGALFEGTGAEGSAPPSFTPGNIPPPGPNAPPGDPSDPARFVPLPPVYRDEAGNAATAEGGRWRLGAAGPRTGFVASVRTADARVTADVNTNSIIVAAEPSVQRVYEELIKRLDKRRPQVLIEVVMVTLDTSQGFTLGVEIAGSNEGEDPKILSFTSFGLSEVDGDTGRLTLTPGLGFNGTVLSTDVADIVIKALKTNGRSRVMSAPKILVNDHATATLDSTQDAPFASVNASNTVSTTSFGGFAQAGTRITVTPHISEGDHLQVEFDVELSNFSGEASEGLPPPRQANTVSSVITVPDGHTVVVGGLNRKNSSETISRVPFLGEIPGLEYLLSSRTKNESESTLFLFIRPVILRDDQFEDLKFLSQRDRDKAQLPSDYPESEPMSVW